MQMGELKGRWEKERDLVSRIREVREKLEINVQAAVAAAAVVVIAPPGKLPSRSKQNAWCS